MDTDARLESLEDQNVLIAAYAASSSYVMRKAFSRSEKLNAFKGRIDLAPNILAKIEQLAKKPSDPVILGAHLYALELTGARPEIQTAILRILEEERLRDHPLVGQLAGEIGFKFVKAGIEPSPGGFLSPDELKVIVKSIKQEVGR